MPFNTKEETYVFKVCIILITMQIIKYIMYIFEDGKQCVHFLFQSIKPMHSYLNCSVDKKWNMCLYVSILFNSDTDYSFTS